MRKHGHGDRINGGLRLKTVTPMTLVHTSHNVFYGKTSRDAYHFYI